MEQETREQLELTLKDCLDRAEVCEADSEDYFKLIQKATSIAEVLNAEKKIESEREVELKKIEENGKITSKDMLCVGGPLLGGGLGLLYRSYILKKQTRMICNFEKYNTFTTSAGRSLAQVFRELFRFR